MRKLRKVMALILTLAMVMGLSLTAFAAPKNSATITVENADNATLSMVQVIKADPKTETGWAFVGNAAAAYKTAFGVENDQDAIWMLIGAKNSEIELPRELTPASAAQINQALNLVSDEFKTFTNGSAVYEAGVYVINAVEKDYTYNKMAAYVGFGEIKDDEGTVINGYPSLIDAVLEAKKSPISIEKDVDDTDGYYAIGQILTYTLETYVPYAKPDETNFKFSVTDDLYNAQYYLTGDKSVAKIELEGETEPIGGAAEFKLRTPGVEDFFTQGFTIDLSQLIDTSNSNAGKKVTITYTVKVTGEYGTSDIWNNAIAHVGDKETDSEKVQLHTGNIILTKYNEERTEKLAGAGFEVRKKLDNGKYSEPLKFKEIINGVYQYAPDELEAVTEIYTADANRDNGDLSIEKGELIITGIDAGEYQFIEKTAPTGYSINSTPVTATLDESSCDNQHEREATKTYVEFVSITDTKLAELPGTGGIGTTIFTIGGCVIMIAAAGLYFASRRKHGEN